MANISGKLFLLIGPSGVGKGVYIDGLKKRHDDWVFPVSVTTREKRVGETEGKTYYFYSKEQFQKEKDAGKFLEWACVHGREYYGLLKKTVFDALEDGKIVFREIDIQGFESVKKVVPKENLTSIFLLPPSLEILKERITRRSPLTDEEIERRMQSAMKEIEKSDECDYILQTVDKDIDGGVLEIEKVVGKEFKI